MVTTEFTQTPVEPDMDQIGPIWFHSHGSKMHLREVIADRGIILLESSAASVQIIRGLRDALVSWEVVYDPNSRTRGQILFGLPHLALAFGMMDWDKDEEPWGYNGSQWLLRRYGGDCAIQGYFIRYQNFINIPGPGTGHDGDPNISLIIDEDIREAVRSILKQ